jgi:hypothetical protein
LGGHGHGGDTSGACVCVWMWHPVASYLWRQRALATPRSALFVSLSALCSCQQLLSLLSDSALSRLSFAGAERGAGLGCGCGGGQCSRHWGCAGACVRFWMQVPQVRVGHRAPLQSRRAARRYLRIRGASRADCPRPEVQGRHQIESPIRLPKESAQGRLAFNSEIPGFQTFVRLPEIF